VRCAKSLPPLANDYVETRISVESLCHIGSNCTVIETTMGYAIIKRSVNVGQGCMVLIEHCGRNQFVKRMGAALCASLEGEALDDVSILSVVTYLINDVTWLDDDEILVYFNGSLRKHPHSISFANMGEIEFQQIYKAALDVDLCCSYYVLPEPLPCIPIQQRVYL
jgi:DNA polymerase V